LVERLLDHVLLALLESPGVDQVVVVSPDPAVLDRASRAGMTALDECLLAPPQSPLPPGDGSDHSPEKPRHHPRLGHNAVLEQARAHVMAWKPTSLLVVSADLPLLQPANVETMLALAANEPTMVIAPDRHQLGTNVLLLRPPGAIPFHFGPTSLADHSRDATARGVTVTLYQSIGTAFDVDLPEDLDALGMTERNLTEESGPTSIPWRRAAGLPPLRSKSGPQTRP
jgi:2-phospho-L-lactate/phosphoenolpyruvate guanylyltransferase